MIKKWIFYVVTSVLCLVIVVLSVLVYSYDSIYGKNETLSVGDVDASAYEGLPIIEINTENQKLPKDKENYVNCSFSISNTQEGLYDFSVSMKEEYGDENSVGIRLRGNSTLKQAKKPYRIKFDKKTSLFGLDKAKSWVLLADYMDYSKIKNYSALTMGNTIFTNLGFVPTPNHVVLFINGVYKGLYVLTEQIDEKEGRTNIETDIDVNTAVSGTDYEFPFLIEIGSKDFVDGINGFTVDGLGSVEIKYPDFDGENIDSNRVVFDYIKEYISSIYKLIKNGGTIDVSFRENPVALSNLIDEASLIDYYLLNELMLNRDASHYSIYINKAVGRNALMGPVWDFDTASMLAYDYTSDYANLENKMCLAYNSELFKPYLENGENYIKVQSRWQEIDLNVSDFVNQYLSEYKKRIYSAASFDAEYWYSHMGITGSVWFFVSYDSERAFLISRVDYLRKVFEYNHSDFINEVNTNYLPY